MYDVKIKDRAYLKNTGIRADGTIIGIIDSIIYNSLFNEKWQTEPAKRWNKLYPDWMQKPVVMFQFDKPQKVCSFEEYCERDKRSVEELKIEYEALPDVPIVQAPIDDVYVMNF